MYRSGSFGENCLRFTIKSFFYMNTVSGSKQYYNSVIVFILTASFLAIIQLKLTNNPIILLERFFNGGGWIEIAIISTYAAIIAYKMRDPFEAPRWRLITWTVFSSVFFLQLALGLLGAEKFLMTGKLHLPVPFMIVSGPIYRGEISIMPVLFLSTIILTGPAWCSQLCYFGAFDNLASKGKTRRGNIEGKTGIKTAMFVTVIFVTIILRLFGVPVFTATLLAAGFGIMGIAVMIWYSRKQHRMIHCLLYCPVGSLVNILRFVNPFRLYIDDSCTLCMKCTSLCKYDALNPDDIRSKKPGYTCTLCGDCLAGCRDNSIKYKFFRIKPDNARNLYLILTVSLHAIFLALARI